MDIQTKDSDQYQFTRNQPVQMPVFEVAGREGA